MDCPGLECILLGFFHAVSPQFWLSLLTTMWWLKSQDINFFPVASRLWLCSAGMVMVPIRWKAGFCVAENNNGREQA
jgi:hypothetical protein